MRFFVLKKNIRGAWVIYGQLGVKQYYYYTKNEALELYKSECKKKLFEVQNGRKGYSGASL